jgi:hypothetical protein
MISALLRHPSLLSVFIGTSLLEMLASILSFSLSPGYLLQTDRT